MNLATTMFSTNPMVEYSLIAYFGTMFFGLLFALGRSVRRYIVQPWVHAHIRMMGQVSEAVDKACTHIAAQTPLTAQSTLTLAKIWHAVKPQKEVRHDDTINGIKSEPSVERSTIQGEDHVDESE